MNGMKIAKRLDECLLCAFLTGKFVQVQRQVAKRRHDDRRDIPGACTQEANVDIKTKRCRNQVKSDIKQEKLLTAGPNAVKIRTLALKKKMCLNIIVQLFLIS